MRVAVQQAGAHARLLMRNLATRSFASTRQEGLHHNVHLPVALVQHPQHRLFHLVDGLVGAIHEIRLRWVAVGHGLQQSCP